MVILRSFVEGDLAAVLAIEQASSAFPWTREAFLSEHMLGHSHLFVVEADGQVVGYLCFWLAGGEGQVANVAVHPLHRRRGFGRMLLQTALSHAQRQGVDTVSLEVRESNTPAISLYQEFGFHEVAVRRRYYPNGEDALLMVCELL